MVSSIIHGQMWCLGIQCLASNIIFPIFRRIYQWLWFFFYCCCCCSCSCCCIEIPTMDWSYQVLMAVGIELSGNMLEWICWFNFEAAICQQGSQFRSIDINTVGLVNRVASNCLHWVWSLAEALIALYDWFMLMELILVNVEHVAFHSSIIQGLKIFVSWCMMILTIVWEGQY